ncbi:MAG: hypothetical protein K0B08_07495 [Bacteroidales bacterium]|nr:hypothetical protein [Bacteroidales bacterium]
MKKSASFRVISLFFLLAIVFASCVKDGTREIKPAAQPVLKSGSDFGLPIYLSQNTLIGEAEFYIENEAIVVNVLLNEGYMPSEAHLYAGENAPPSPAPGLFPYHWYAGGDYPISFVIDISDWWGGSTFDWHFALHLKIGNESAWLLPEEGGTNWLNNGGKPIGWGQYFLYNFIYYGDIQVIDLKFKADITIFDEDGWWPPDGNWTFPFVNDFPAYSFCLNDIWMEIDEMDVSVPLQADHMNAFSLLGETDPFFYIKWDGDVYSLIDGAQYDLNGTIQPLLIDSKEYNFGTHSCTGTILGENGTTVEIILYFNFDECP